MKLLICLKHINIIAIFPLQVNVFFFFFNILSLSLSAKCFQFDLPGGLLATLEMAGSQGASGREGMVHHSSSTKMSHQHVTCPEQGSGGSQKSVTLH